VIGYTTFALMGSVIGAWLVAKHNVAGFYIWLVANTLWLIDSVGRGDVNQSILWIYYTVTCVVGIKSWHDIPTGTKT
jgi:hypothetical protein